MTTHPNIAIIGGGPAGLRAAEVAAAGGAKVTLYEAMRSVGRKFLVAGKSGLNLTNAEELESFLKNYNGSELPVQLWRAIISDFDNTALRQWAAGLGIETFTASSGKVFPVPIHGTIKAAPLLRRWLERLRGMGVVFLTNHRWIDINTDGCLTFLHGQETVQVQPDATILALGGASWPQTGSNANWTHILSDKDISITPLTSANCGWEISWPDLLLEIAEGLPMKNLLVRAGDSSQRGELVITRYGLEGGPIYKLGSAIRSLAEPHIIVDFKPDTSLEELISRMANVTRNFTREAGRRWKLDSATCAILKHLPNRGPWKSGEQLAREVKHCHIPLIQPRPLQEAISSAGGICWNELNEDLMLKKLPSVYAAGEMISWEAPTGGYLLQACFATGDHAGRSAIFNSKHKI